LFAHAGNAFLPPLFIIEVGEDKLHVLLTAHGGSRVGRLGNGKNGDALFFKVAGDGNGFGAEREKRSME
jgi:hypothetical protein